MAGADPDLPLSPLATALIQGTAPRPIRISAARGVLPLARPELLRVLVALHRDADEQVRGEADSALAAISSDELSVLLGDTATSREVLHHFTVDPGCDAARLDLLIANPSTPGKALAAVVPRFSTAQIDQLLLNQTRLIAAPSLLDRIADHPSITAPQRARVEEFRRHFLEAPRRSAPEPAAPAPPPAAVPKTAPAVTAPLPPSPAPEDAPAEEAPADEAALDNATRRIMRMNTAEKIQLAFKGGREERTILIKDSSKSVQEAVLQSPKITENEIETIARMRSVTEDVLRIIAGNREWGKNYVVIHALATNPRTPASIAMNMVTRLNNRDLKLVAGDRNVSEIVRRQARKTMESRNERAGGRH
jgi:hypothetical protein